MEDGSGAWCMKPSKLTDFVFLKVVCFFLGEGVLLVWWLVVWIPGIPENERDCYLGVPRFESQTTSPNQQLTIS